MKINFNKNAVKYNTAKAMLVKVPKSNYLVWLPDSLVHIKHWYLEAYLPDSMTFTLLINKNKKQKCSAESLCELFESTTKEDPVITVTEHKPEPIKPKKVDAIDELKR